MKSSHLTLFILSLFLTSCSQEENYYENYDKNLKVFSQYTPIELIEQNILNVSYGEHPDQVFDIYLPQGRTPNKTKVIMVVHGGNWMNGDKSSMTDFVLDLKAQNPDHAIVNLNYILGGSTHYACPNQFLDIGQAINLIKNNRVEYQINPEFGLLGSSSGGHLTLQYAYKHDVNNDIKFVGSLGGPTNFLDSFYDDYFINLEDLLVDKDYYYDIYNSTNINFAKILSPIYQVREDSPATILFYGNEDLVVPFSNGEILEQYLIDNNIPHDFNMFQGGHGAWYTDSYEATLHSNISAFIETHLPINE
ncbi:acetyl esterase, putative [unidentified eubacterium SCB49]|nr:acetyl esterase, putative [unidentified eubacterium SCB49]